LTEVEGDLLILGRALFARTPSGDGESLDLHWNSEFACTSARTRLPSTGAAWHRRALITFAAASTLSFSTGFAADSVNHEIIMTDVRSDGHDFRQGAARAAIGCSSSHGACPLGQIKRDANPASIPTPMGAGVEAAALLKF